MKSAPFQYHRAESIDHATELLDQLGDEAKVIAGGQSLVPMMAMRLARPAHLVDICRVDELSSLEAHAGMLHVGAAVRQRRAELSEEVQLACPLLSEVLPWVAHVAVRTRGTVCGSLAHADPAAEIPVVARLLEATLTIVGVRTGRREVTAEHFFHSYLTTDLAPDELLVSVDFPVPPARTGHAFLEVARRRHGDFALVALGALVTVDEAGTLQTCRLGVGGAGEVPARLTAAEALLTGRPVEATIIAEAAVAAADEIDPLSDIHGSAVYRRHLVRRLLPDVLTAAARRAVAS